MALALIPAIPIIPEELHTLACPVRRRLRPLTQRRFTARKRKLDAGKRRSINLQLVVSRIQDLVAGLIHTRKRRKREVERSGGRRASCDVEEAVVGDERFLGVGLGAEGAGEEAESDVVGCCLSCVVDIDGDAGEGAALEEAAGAVAAFDKIGDGVGLLGLVADASGEVGVVQTVAELEDGLAGVPLVGTARVLVAWAHGHVCHWYLGDVFRWILCLWETSCRSSFSSEDVDDGSATILTGVSSPQDSRDLGVPDEWGGIDLTTSHDDYDNRLSSVGELANDIKLATCQGQERAVTIFGFNAIVHSADPNVDVTGGDDAREGRPVGCSRISSTTWKAACIFDVNTKLLKGHVWTSQEFGDSVVVALHLRSGVGPVTVDTNVLRAEVDWENAVILQQNNALLSSFECECLGSASRYRIKAELAIGLLLRCIKVTKFDERRILANEGFIKGSLVCETLLDSSR